MCFEVAVKDSFEVERPFTTRARHSPARRFAFDGLMREAAKHQQK